MFNNTITFSCIGCGRFCFGLLVMAALKKKNNVKTNEGQNQIKPLVQSPRDISSRLGNTYLYFVVIIQKTM